MGSHSALPMPIAIRQPTIVREHGFYAGKVVPRREVVPHEANGNGFAIATPLINIVNIHLLSTQCDHAKKETRDGLFE